MNDTPPFPPPGGHRSSGERPGFEEYAHSYPPPTTPPTGTPYAAPASSTTPIGTLAPPARDSHRRGRVGFAAAVVAAALVVGAGAGVGGAAVYSAASDEGGAGSTSVSTSQVVPSSDTPAADGSVEQVAATVLPSVVELDVSGSQGAGSGSGIILSSDGLVLTNNHVVELADGGGSVTVSFNDGTHATGTVLGTDPLTDTALVQAEGVSGLTPATLGESSGVSVGQDVVAIGSPYGLQSTVTSGIVSALDRPVDVGSDSAGNATVYPAIQTDAAINPGNSGGPLVDLEGHVIGINSSIRSNSGSSGEAGSIGLGFAIPIDEVLPIVEQMKNGETPTHAQIGVSVSDVQGQSGAAVIDGAEIQNINDGSAASEAGLQSGDVITKVDDTLITGSDSLVATVRSYRPGDEVTVTYERDGQEKTATLTLGSDQEMSDS
ncbi:MAG: trypsin [Nocardioides sp.]|nr:trypsin [Nocardioides sp.]